HFDDYADDYDVALGRGLSATGEQKDYFSRRRIEWLSQRLTGISMKPRSVMDFGCGAGSATPFLMKLAGVECLVGVDTSSRSIELAKRSFSNAQCHFTLIDDFEVAQKLDLVYCNGVFHHIPPAERDGAVKYVWRSLRPGGIFALWENNPW